MKKILFILPVLLIFFLINSVYAISLDKKAGQMLIIGFNGDNINSPEFQKVLKYLKKGDISGVILFSKNIKSKEDLILMNEKILSSNKITPFIAIDNEGGYVQRYDFEPVKSAKRVSLLKDEEITKEYSKMADLERTLKINFNFAPCVDLELNKESITAQNERSYGVDYNKVINCAKIFIKEHNKRKIITSIKHFPGHGSIKGDTHKGFVDASETFTKDEIEPYIGLKDFDKLNTVMISHIYNSKFDEKYPASLSKKTIKDLLIKKIGFKGVIVSDDYDMGAIRKNYSLDEIIVNSINSGVNILLFSNNIEGLDDDLVEEYHKIIKRELKKGTINKKDINNSYKKIIKLKNSLLEK